MYWKIEEQIYKYKCMYREQIDSFNNQLILSANTKPHT